MRPRTFEDWPIFLLNSLLKSRTDFAKFVHAGRRCSGPSDARSAELFPIPVPFPWTPSNAIHGASRRKRQRWRRRRAKEILINLQIAGLNFVFGKSGPWHFGIPLTSSQLTVVDNLLLRARSLSRLGGHVFSGCGSKVEDTASELERLHALFFDQDIPYGSNQGHENQRSRSTPAVVVPTVASSVAFPEELQGFNPLPFLDEEFSRAYHDPSCLLHGQYREQPRMMPPDAVSAATRSELLHLGWRWDQVDRLALALPSEIENQDRSGLFCISKPDGELRQIIDRRPRNSRELPPPQDGPKMGHPSSLLGIVIPHGFDLLGSVDDLKNFYHEFQVSHKRGLSTPVGPWWSVSEWEGSKALADLKSRHPRLHLKPSDTIFMCFKGLSMGDHWAPAFAQMAHENLLASHGALKPEEHLRFGEITPRAPLGHFSGVCIDDKLNLQLTPKKFWDVPLRDSESCNQADTAYETAGLTHHPKKRLRRVPVTVAWGAQVEGVCGLIGAKRERLCMLSMATMFAASSSALTRTLVEKILGFWTFCFQFRRCLFSLIQVLYGIGASNGSVDAPFRPTREARGELQLLSILGPTALAQLRRQVSATIYATDAAPGGAGAVSCYVGDRVSQELFRRAESRGFHTKLLPPISAFFQEQGLPVCPTVASHDFEFQAPPALEGDLLPQEPRFVQSAECGVVKISAPGVQAWAQKFWEFSPQAPPDDGLIPAPRKQLSFRFDFIEIYSGCARMTKAFADRGLVVGPPIELKEGWDLFDKDLSRLLLFLCMAGRVAILWLGPPSTTFSLARCPKLRSRAQPLGFDLFNLDVLAGNYHMHLSICLWVAQKCAGRIALLETPWFAFTRFLSAWLWCRHLGGVDIRLDLCRFGTPYLKGTRILGSHTWLRAMGRLCTGDHTHVKLEGFQAACSAAYPFPMCEHVADIVIEGCDALQWHKKSPAHDASHVDVQTGISPPLRDCRSSRKFVSHLWATQLSETLPWKVCKKYKFRKEGHINVLECHARRSLLLNIPAQQRVVVMQDSMVTLGASAKGRSSSPSLNKVLRQECAICVAKDLYVGGIHSPTWALRADDPSRGRSVRLPRAPLPGWFLDLRAGRLAQAQDTLDDLSQTPRSAGRWFLFAAAACLAGVGGFNTIRDWASSIRCASQQRRFGTREGSSDHRCPQKTASGRFCGLDTESGSQCDRSSSFRKFGQGDTHSCDGVAGRIRPSSLRDWGKPTNICGNNQCGPTEIPILEENDDWPVATGNYLGKLTPISNASSNPETSLGGNGEHFNFLEVAPPSSAAFVGLLRFTAACRTFLLEGQALCTERSDRSRQCSSHPAASNKDQNAGSSFSKCPARRAARDRFLAEVFKCHDSERTSLAAFASPV